MIPVRLAKIEIASILDKSRMMLAILVGSRAPVFDGNVMIALTLELQLFERSLAKILVSVEKGTMQIGRLRSCQTYQSVLFQSNRNWFLVS